MKSTYKKILSSIVFVVFCFCVILSNNLDNNIIAYNKDERFSATYVVPNTLEELEQSSPIIVKGYFNGTRDIDKDKNVVGPSSISQFKVDEVVKGHIDEKVISIIEPCKVDSNNFINVEGYIPMQTNQEYMLYLRANDTEYGVQYSIISLNFGKYNLSSNKEIVPFRSKIDSFDEIAELDFVTESQDVCQKYNDIKREILKDTKGTITTYSYSAQILTKEDAFYEFRILPYNNIKVYLDKSVTDSYQNHTNAYNNALDKISNISDTDISFNRVYDNSASLTLSSTSSSKEEWVGIARITYNEFINPVPTLTSASVFINDYKIKTSDLTKEHTYQVALHELGHCFGLLHQDQLLSSETIMVPYVLPTVPGQTDFYNLDKHNLTYAYPKKTDWQSSWAKDQIDEFLYNGYIDGYPDGSFRPDNSITRAEFVKIFNKVFGLTNKSDVEFNDTKTHWAKDDIDIAVTNGVADGVSATEFMPDKTITREEAAKMISNYKGLSDSVYNKLSTYKDSNQVSSWAKDDVEGVIEVGFMTGYGDDTFRPKNNITRAEAVVTLSRIK